MDAMDLLLNRHSATKLAAPGPDRAQLEAMLQAGLRAPDHGRLRPWQFVIIAQDQREEFGTVLAHALKAREPGVSDQELERERSKALRAPVILVAAARLRPGHKIPEVEQLLAAGAAAENIVLAAQAQGFGAMWKTGGPAYDLLVKQALGLSPQDAIVGFLYIGTDIGQPSTASRPELKDHVSIWSGGPS